MNQDEPNEQQEKPAAEQPVAGANPGPLQAENRFRGGPRRSSRGGGRRGNRGDRGGDRGGQPRGDRPYPPEGGQPRGNDQRRPVGNIGQAIEQVEHIRMELNKVLAEINEVMETLELAEREKTASEQEIDKLRDSLRSLHREPSYPRPQRNFAPSRPQAPAELPPASPEDRSEDSDE